MTIFQNHFCNIYVIALRHMIPIFINKFERLVWLGLYLYMGYQRSHFCLSKDGMIC